MSKSKKRTNKIYTEQFINDLEASPLKALDNYNYNNQTNLEKLILDAKETYYNNKNILKISDNCFDELIEILEELYPKSKVIDIIGSDINLDSSNVKKVKLPYHLGSMDKVKPGSRNLTLWFKKYNIGPYIVSEKLDGLSGLLIISLDIKNKQIISKLYSRGNGDIGQDISHLLPFLKLNKNNKDSLTSRYNDIKEYMLSSNIDKIAIRGEIVMSKSIFDKKYSNKYPKARSIVAGIVNSKSEAFNDVETRNKAKDIDFVSYQVIYPNLKASDQFNMLEDKLNFKSAYNKILNKLLMSECSQLLLEYKKNSIYEIDGIIITDNSKIYDNPKNGNPKYSVAFKMPLEDTQAKETIVEYVEYNVSKNGILKPRIKYNPIIIGGDRLVFTTGFNAKYIKDNKLGPGSKISIIKSGDVIPYIYKVLSPSKSGLWQEPQTKWHWNINNIEAVIDDIDDLPIEKVMLQFFNQFDIDGLKEGLIIRLINAGFTTINDILRLKEESLLSIDGFQIKSSKKLISQLKEKIILKKHPLYRIMVASNCFPNFGIKKLELITSNFNVKDILENKIKIEDLENIDGIGNITGLEFLKYLDKFILWLQEHNIINIDMNYNTTQKNNNIVYDQFIDGKKIVFTGFRNKNLEEYIKRNNGKVLTDISQNTDILVAKDINKVGSKLGRAKLFNIDILDLETFLKSINFKS